MQNARIKDSKHGDVVHENMGMFYIRTWGCCDAQHPHVFNLGYEVSIYKRGYFMTSGYSTLESEFLRLSKRSIPKGCFLNVISLNLICNGIFALENCLTDI